MCKITDTAIEEIKTVFPNLNISEEFERQRLIQLQWKEEVDEDRYDNSYSEDDFEPTYDRYNGSYAQDEMEYSDDDIDTIFDGDPLAYWNID